MMIGAIVQSRMDSKRFPGKVLYQVRHKPMIQYLLESLSRCTRIDRIVMATSLEGSDDPIHGFCRDYGIACHRGPLTDVAGRILETARAYGFNAFVRVNGDSPLLDHRLVDRAVKMYASGKYDLVTNVLTRTYPKGQSVEVLDAERFAKTYPLMDDTADQEHVTTYFYKHPEDFSIRNFESGGRFGAFQLSVDTVEDMRVFEALVGSFDMPHWNYSYEDLIKCLNSLSSQRSL